MIFLGSILTGRFFAGMEENTALPSAFSYITKLGNTEDPAYAKVKVRFRSW
jgi:hypothetical protein